MSVPERHRALAPREVSVYVITVSTSRYLSRQEGRVLEDEAGDVAEALAREAGYAMAGRALVPDDIAMIRAALAGALGKADVIVITGGTGLSPKDVTIEAVRPLLDKELEGFGELLRYLSYQRIGAAAALTRATAGALGRSLVLCLPGSPDAVETALRAFLMELPHALYVLRQAPDAPKEA